MLDLVRYLTAHGTTFSLQNVLNVAIHPPESDPTFYGILERVDFKFRGLDL
jgi:hypothetical protein